MPDLLDPAILSTLTDIRDGVLALLAIGAAVILLALLIALFAVSRRALRIVRWMQRQHDNRAAAGLDWLNHQLSQSLADDRWSPNGLLATLRSVASAASAVAAKRRRPKKRRLFGLLPPA